MAAAKAAAATAIPVALKFAVNFFIYANCSRSPFAICNIHVYYFKSLSQRGQNTNSKQILGKQNKNKIKLDRKRKGKNKHRQTNMRKIRLGVSGRRRM